MDIEKILQEYDSMFGHKSLDEIEDFLCKKIEEAASTGQYGVLISLLNEIIGFCRDTTQRDKSLSYCKELMEILHGLGMEGSLEYATSLLNIANACRAFGLFEESLKFHQTVYETYQKFAKPDDYMYASLFNNWSLLYQEMGDYKKAEKMLLKSMAVIDLYDNAVINQATTRTNLAMTLIKLCEENSKEESEDGFNENETYKRAMEYLNRALEIFEKDGGRDFHYGAALVAMGDAYSYKKDYENAALYYQKGMAEIEKHVGRTDNYDRVELKYKYARQHINQTTEDITETEENNIERSRKFYEEYGKTMIHEKFPEYEGRIAVGIAGEGSDCFGFDDEISADHDYEVGFSMWLSDSDYEKIGDRLTAEYEKICPGNKGFIAVRRGVSTIREFYGRILGIRLTDKDIARIKEIVSKNTEYSCTDLINLGEIDEYRLAHAVNGEVFKDDEGIFSAVRQYINSYYPEKIWREKLAGAIHDFSQYAQSNYGRMMARKDYTTANICVYKAIESAMDIAYLVNKVYAPYYKWKRKGLEVIAGKSVTEKSELPKLLQLLDTISLLPADKEAWEDTVYNAGKVNEKDERVRLFEEVAKIILNRLKSMELVSGNDTFLELYLGQILRGKNMDIIEKIVELEWKQFDKVENEGGRASCQDDFTTFNIMRKSQYMTWNENMLKSYYNDLMEARNKGWNLITEKYARMMKSTAPERYAEFELKLPPRSDERQSIQEEIIKIQVAWMEEFAKEFPNMAVNARTIHTYEDTPYNTSYETYLRGELGTYSEVTFILYGRFITELLQEGRNLAYETMNNTAKLYGYESVEDAEKKMRESQ